MMVRVEQVERTCVDPRRPTIPNEDRPPGGHAGFSFVGAALMALALSTSGCGNGSDVERESAALRSLLRQPITFFGRPTVDVDDIQPVARQFYRERG